MFGKLVAECQAIWDYTAARDDGGGSTSSWNSLHPVLTAIFQVDLG